MHSIMDKIMNFSVYLISILGYPGLFVTGALEFLGLPVSGEVLIPLAGFMVKKGDLNFWLSFIILNLGSILATLGMYAVGYFFNNWARNLIRKKLYKNEDKLNNLSNWFKKNGSMVSLVARFIPFVRVYVSLIAGIERVPVISFTLYSSIGIVIWNGFFFILGYYLGDYKPYLKYLTEYKGILLVLSLIILLLIIGIILLIKKRKNKR